MGGNNDGDGRHEIALVDMTTCDQCQQEDDQRIADVGVGNPEDAEPEQDFHSMSLILRSWGRKSFPSPGQH